MKISQLMQGLEILRKHFKGEDGYHMGALHEQFFVDVTDTPLSNDEVVLLKDLGWVQETHDYDPDESWYCYV